MKLLKEIWIRWSLESPIFFKKIVALLIKLGILATAIGLAILGIPQANPNIVLPESASTYAGYFIVFGTIMGVVGPALASLTVEDKELLNKIKEEKGLN